MNMLRTSMAALTADMTDNGGRIALM